MNTSFRRVYTLGLLLLLVLPCRTSPAQEGPPEFSPGAMHTLNNVHQHRLESTELGRHLELLVRLPDDYDASLNYPVVYLLDGGFLFPLLAAYQRYLESDQLVPQAILVGVGYPSADWRQGNNRAVDYSLPSESAEHYGGASRFQAALAGEVLPWVEQHYAADANQRVLFGQSLGGQFVLFNAQSQARLFFGHIASNPALHQNLELFLPTASETGTGTRLFVAAGAEDDPRFKDPLKRWMAAAGESAGDTPQRRMVRYPGQHHGSLVPDAYRDGMIWIFTEPGASDGN